MQKPPTQEMLDARIRRRSRNLLRRCTTGIEETLGVGIGIGIETEADTDLNSDRDADKPKQQNIFMHLGATPAHGRLVRNAG
jgi:hypothetical protein